MKHTVNLLSYHHAIQKALDLLGLTVSFLFFIMWQYADNDISKNFYAVFILHYKALILLLLSWLFIAGNTKLYDINRTTKMSSIQNRLAMQTIVFGIVVMVISALKNGDLFSTQIIVFFILSLFVSACLTRLIYIWIANIYRSTGKNLRKVVFVDKNHNTDDFIHMLNRQKNLGFDVRGIFLKNTQSNAQQQIFALDFDLFKQILKKENINQIFFSLSGDLTQQEEERIVDIASRRNIPIEFIPSPFYDNYRTMEMEYYGTLPVLKYRSFPLDNLFSRALKRVLDIILSSLIILLIMSWLTPLIALAIVIDSGFPVFYIQKRIGFRGRRFKCLKFRSMSASKANDILKTQKNDARITRVGAFLRKTSLDEFPQFFNVWLGNMSLVGPRPHMVSEDEFYKKTIRRYYMRHYVPPGITGLAQSNGLRGAVNTDADMVKRIVVDTYYVRNWSIWLDINIFFKTFFNLWKKDENVF